MQAEGKLPAGCVVHAQDTPAHPSSVCSHLPARSTPRRYPSAVAAYGIIARTEGIAGLWTGVGPNIGRNALINAAELASYDQVRLSALFFVRRNATHTARALSGEAVAAARGAGG